MSNPFRSFISFSHTERMGVIGLCLLLAVLLIARTLMSYLVHTDMDAAHTAIFKRSFSNFTNTAPVTKKDSIGPAKDFQDHFDESTAPMPDIININTADSATLVRLKGIGPATAHKILLRRTEKGPFTAIVQLKECGRIPSATFSIIAPHLSVR